MSSLIDVSFLLLIFFIATSTLQPPEADLGMDIGGTGGIVHHDVDFFTIEVNSDGAVVGNDETLDANLEIRDLPQLRDRLIGYKAAADLSDSKAVVIVKAADEAKGQRFVDVLNCVARVGIEDVTLAMF